MKRILLGSILFFSFQVFSETYICSQELSNFGKPGEIETVVFKRNGNSFNYQFEDHVGVDEFEITAETESLIILTDVFQGDSIDIVFLNKKTKEFGRRYLKFEDFKTPRTPTYGKCVVLN